MRIPIESLRRSIDEARKISEIHILNYIDAANNIRSTDDLRDLCQRFLEKDIEYGEHNITYHEDHPIRGFFLAINNGEKYRITLLSGQNYCWKRMVLCKELFHVLLYDDNCRNNSIKNLLEEATTIKLQTEKDKLPYEPLQWELLAEIAAVEFLFPYQERKKKMSGLASSVEIPDYGAIAEQYKIPRAIVEQYLSSSRMSVLKDF